jgi:hypothetical protein
MNEVMRATKCLCHRQTQQSRVLAQAPDRTLARNKTTQANVAATHVHMALDCMLIKRGVLKQELQVMCLTTNTDGACLCSALRSVGSVKWLQVYNYLNEPLTYMRIV